MVDLAKLKVGDKVHYVPFPGSETWENGVVKSIVDDRVFVVYNCAGNWDDYKNYTGQNTSVNNLKLGWKHE